jgi:hypothetical protein
VYEVLIKFIFNTLSLFDQVAMHNLPAGQYCQTCHEGAGKCFFYTWRLAVFNSYCIEVRLGEVVVNGKKIRQCKGCKEKTCNLQDGETFMLKFILPPLTSTPVNFIFPLMRKSTGGKVELGNLQFQYSFIRNWW